MRTLLVALVGGLVTAFIIGVGIAAIGFEPSSTSKTYAMSTTDTNGTNHVSTSHFRRRSHEARH
jgi:hypothetical protein